MKTVWLLNPAAVTSGGNQTTDSEDDFFGCLYPWASERVGNLCGGHMRYREARKVE